MKLSDYIMQSATLSSFGKSAITSFVILSDIEKRIKEKIEQVGTPLKEWDINIYRGILTGYNEAFIIDGKTKDELIEKSPKNAEIIRPNNLYYLASQTIDYLSFSVHQYLQFALICHSHKIISALLLQDILLYQFLKKGKYISTKGQQIHSHIVLYPCHEESGV